MLGTGGHYGAAGRKAAGMYESLRDLREGLQAFLVRPAWALTSRCKSDTGFGSANR